MDFILSTLGSIGFNYHIALANFVNFLIVLFVLNKFVFKKVVKGVEERDALIKKGLTDASEAEEKLRLAKKESDEIVTNAKIEAEKDTKIKIDLAMAEAADIVKNNKEKIEKLESELKTKIENTESLVMSEFKKVAPDLMVKMFKDVFSKNLDEKSNDLLIKSLIK